MEIININGEEFKKSKFDRYYVSKDAKTISVDFDEYDNIKKIVYMKYDFSDLGYARVPIKVDRRLERKISVHRLVYDTWVGISDESNVIDHIDANPSNNHLSNLRECTQKQNIEFSIEKGNFGKGNSKKIRVLNKETQKVEEFQSGKDFIAYYQLPCKNGSIKKLISTKWFNEKFEVIDIG